MEIGNLLQLQYINLTWNSLTGTIYANMSYCKKLRSLSLEYNSMVGKLLPDQFSLLSKLNYLGLGRNNLTGDIGLTLPNFKVFVGVVNDFTGPIPVSLSNASKLGILELSQNKLTENVPTSLGQLQGLYKMNFEINSLGRNTSRDLRFLDFLVNCTSLQVLSFEDNIFGR
ncbi:hypothetical protein RDI58_017541 [Solanum bulbocastanum]|uniref:Non-specific serine/threonine protein kinase n=1 Tax=Solanum bulbocastanum TaxID=147425 RepID=A0AAN8TFN3_SOLBU